MKRLFMTLAAAGVAGAGLRRLVAPTPPSLSTTPEPGPGPLPLEDELALVEDAEPQASAEPAGRVDEQDTMEVDIVDVVDDLLEPETRKAKRQ
jgi:hypothetical protein